MSFSELISPLVGRLVLAWFFVSASLELGAHWSSTIALMTFKGLPAPAVLLAGAIVLMILGGISLALGFHARVGALLLFAFTIIASVMMHAYWKIDNNTVARADDYEIFARNIAIAGGLLLIVGMGAGPFSVDNQMGQQKKR
jgi:putative oxidoreductase